MVTRIVGRRPGNIFLHFRPLAGWRRMDNDPVRDSRKTDAMKRRFVLSLLLLSLLGAAGGAWAQPAWRDMPPDERRQMRQQMREHWQQERETREMRGYDEAPRWRDVPPEDRRRLRDEMRERRGWPDHREGPGGGGRGWRRD